MADYFELLQTRRSIRDFEDKSGQTDLVPELIREYTPAPNSGNGHSAGSARDEPNNLKITE